jgi:hypothetical protein
MSPLVRSIVTAKVDAVVKLQMKLLASALPARSVAALLTVAVYGVLPVRLADGVNVAVLPLMLTVPATFAPPAVGRSVKLVIFTLALAMASENVALTVAATGTLVAPLAGEVDDTVGRVVSPTPGIPPDTGSFPLSPSSPPPLQDTSKTVQTNQAPRVMAMALPLRGGAIAAFSTLRSRRAARECTRG